MAVWLRYALWARPERPADISDQYDGDAYAKRPRRRSGEPFSDGSRRGRRSSGSGARHVAGRSRPRWHLDYLRPYLEPMSAWVSLPHQRAEHYWARALSELDLVIGVIWRFGCTDCRCPSHLFFTTTDPSYFHVRRALGRFKNAPLRRVDLRLFENLAAHV